MIRHTKTKLFNTIIPKTFYFFIFLGNQPFFLNKECKPFSVFRLLFFVLQTKRLSQHPDDVGSDQTFVR